MSIVIGYDATHANIARLPKGAQAAGYTTGSPDIKWTAADWAAHPGALRICQDALASDTTADYLDIERYAATNGEAARWYRAALASYHAAKRPGQRWPALYTSASNVTPLVNALKADGVASGPKLIIANWNLTQAQAIAEVITGVFGSFSVVGVQFADPGPYDINVFSRAWLDTVSGQPPPALPPSTDWMGTIMGRLPELKAGSTGMPVKRAQALLNLTTPAAYHLQVDGIFGHKTEAAVGAEQHAKGLTADGVVGPRTWAVLITGSDL